MPTTPGIEDLMQKSTYVFQGTVERLGAASSRSIRVSPKTAVVRVDRTLHAPATLSDQTGLTITIELTNSQPIRVGEDAIFFAAEIRVYAESVGVKETGRWTVGEEQIAQISEAVKKLPDQHVQRRASVSDVVIVGKVSEIRPVRPREPYPMSRRDPDWHEAVIDVQSLEKGSLPEKQVVVVFPMGTHRVWESAPKFQVGQEGVFILHKTQVQLLRRQGYVALDPSDFHAMSQLGRIRGLIKGG